MKYNKGFSLINILVIVLAAGVIGGFAYYAGKNQKDSENEITSSQSMDDIYQQDTTQTNPVSIKNNTTPSSTTNQTSTQPSQQQANNSCLVITYPVAGSDISFPLTMSGYIDVVGAEAGTCTRWGAFEGTAGDVIVKDTNGNTKSGAAKIYTVNDFYVGMQQWPVTATIPSLTEVPYTNEISFHLAGDEQRDGFLPATQIVGPFTVVPYP